MIFFITKVAVTTALVVAISEIARRNSFVAAILASIPLVSVLAIIWLYIDTRDVVKVASLATSVFWLVLPSLAFFVALPVLLKQGLSFYASLLVSMVVTAVCYFLMVSVLEHYGIKL